MTVWYFGHQLLVFCLNPEEILKQQRILGIIFYFETADLVIVI